MSGWWINEEEMEKHGVAMASFYRMALFIFCIMLQSGIDAASKPQGPVNVEADRGTFDLKLKAHHFQGRVHVVQADFSVDADQAWVEGEPGRQIVRATGSPVQVAWPSEHIKANALQVEYQQVSGELRLTGKVHLDQNGNTLESEQVRYFLATRAAIAEGGGASSQGKGRVRMRWIPEEQKNTSPAQKNTPATSSSSGSSSLEPIVPSKASKTAGAL